MDHFPAADGLSFSSAPLRCLSERRGWCQATKRARTDGPPSAQLSPLVSEIGPAASLTLRLRGGSAGSRTTALPLRPLRALSLSLPLLLSFSLSYRSSSAEADSSRLAGAEAAAAAAATQLDIQAAWLAPLLPSLAAATASPAAQTSVLWLFLPNALGVSERTLNSEVGRLCHRRQNRAGLKREGGSSPRVVAETRLRGPIDSHSRLLGGVPLVSETVLPAR